MINRINLILRAKNITAKQFAEEIGIQPSGMSHIMGGRNNPSLEFVSKVLRRYPEIDANWLLLGRGEMYASGTTAPSAYTPSAASAASTPAEPQPAAEPTLFGDESPLPPADEAVAPTPQPYAEVEEQTGVAPKVEEDTPHYAPSYIVSAPQEETAVPDCKRRLTRILMVYSDNTFVEYHPAES